MTIQDFPVATRGFRLQRHVESLHTWTKYYADDKKQKATVSTGLSIEYCVHTKEVEGATDNEYVVLIMGYGTTKEAWAITVDQLLEAWSSPTKNLQIVSYDNRGIGGTEAPSGPYTTAQMAEDAVALMDHLGWQRAHVMGVSMGGMIALELAANAPKRVASLTLLVTSRGKYRRDENREVDRAENRPENREDNRGDMTKALFSKDQDVAITNVLTILYPDSFLAQKMADKDSTIRDELYNFYKTRLDVTTEKSNVGIQGQGMACMTHWVSDDRLAAIGQAGFPVLVVGGGQDKRIPGRESQIIATGMNNSDRVKVVIFEDGGHGLTTQYIDELVQEYIALFQRASP